MKPFQWEGGQGCCWCNTSWLSHRGGDGGLVKSLLCHLYSCVQPPLCGFKHKLSFMYLQKPSHRSIFFKEMLRFVLSDNAATLSNATHEERENFPKKHSKLLFVPPTHAAMAEGQSCMWLGPGEESAQQPLPGCPRQSRISPGPPFPSQHRAQSSLGVQHNQNLATRFKIKGTELHTLLKIWHFAEVSKCFWSKYGHDH